jgi:hypothetical protein
MSTLCFHVLTSSSEFRHNLNARKSYKKLKYSIFMRSWYFYCPESSHWSRDSSVGIATKLRVGIHRNRSCIPWRAKRPSLPHNIQTCFRAHQISFQCVPRAHSAEVKWSEREIDQSPPPCAEVKISWSCTSVSPYAFSACCLIKHTDSFAFTFM